MTAVGRGDEPTPDFRLEIVLAHQAPDLLVIDDKALLPQRGANATVVIAFEFVADFEHGFDNCIDRQLHDRNIGCGKQVRKHAPGARVRIAGIDPKRPRYPIFAERIPDR